MKSLLVGIKNVILWSYARGTWQYDTLCLAIVLAVFLVPSRYFGDRDRASNAAETYVEAQALGEFLKRQHRTIDKLERFTSPDGKVIYRIRFK